MPAGNPSLPDNAPSHDQTALVIEDFLTHGGNLDHLKDTLLSWAQQSHQHAVDVQSADLTNDGVDEVIVIAQYAIPDVDGYSLLGQLYIFECGQAGYQLAFQSEQQTWDDPLSGIFAVEDINATGILDVMYVWGFCGVSLCTVHVQALEWSDSTQTFRELIPTGAEMAQAQLSLADTNKDDVQEIVIETSGTISSLSIGTRFEEKVIYAWNGEAYEVTEHIIGECRVLCTPTP